MNTLLKPLAAGFGLGVALRRAAYDRGWLKAQRLRRPVISVGNLTVGGTGKTPLVAYIARRLFERGLKPAILTRGYGRRDSAKLVVLEPGLGRAPDPRQVGDEPALLARKLPDVSIVIGADRYQAGALAEEQFGVDAHILDDGFQHWALKRDVDIILIDVTHDLSEWALLPAGRLREPASALERADIIVLTRTDLADARSVEERVRQISPLARIFHSHTKLSGLVDVATGRVYPLGAFQGEPVYAFCGIGNPKAFFADLKKWGFSVVARHAFRDHHPYPDDSPETVELMKAQDRRFKVHNGSGEPELAFACPKRCGAKVMVTTEKDMMNLPPLKRGDIPVVACVIEIEIDEDQAFEDVLLERLPRPQRVKV